jgi:DNA (cytosine-5)-methyltransferase 1
MPVFKLGELFCGPGGLARGALGARSADPGTLIRHEWATDYDPDACATYRNNICPARKGQVVCCDVRELDMSKLAPVDALAFGFPCNDFSHVGEHKGMDGNYGPLYSYGIEAVKRFKPKWFLAENVGGLRNANDGTAFKTILKEMADCGYALTPHLYRFEDYGVPQARHRIIIAGVRDDQEAVFRVPSRSLRRIADNSCRAALENPPVHDGLANNERTRQSPTVVERLEHIKPGENAFNADLPERLKLNVKGALISQIYRRLDPDKPSYTVTGSGGGGTHVYHWSEPRALTNRERARLQTFPDDFVFSGSKNNVRRQIGMAVPVEGARIIFEAMLNSFAGVSYEWERPNLGMHLGPKAGPSNGQQAGLFSRGPAGPLSDQPVGPPTGRASRPGRRASPSAAPTLPGLAPPDPSGNL